MNALARFIVLAAFGFLFAKMILPTTLDVMVENSRAQTVVGR